MVAEVSADIGIIAARIAGEDPEMDRVAGELLGLVKVEAARHRDSGQFIDSLIVKRSRGRRGVMDRVVVAEDPLAAVKELGHAIVDADGIRVGFVPGQFNMAKAVQKLPVVE